MRRHVDFSAENEDLDVAGGCTARRLVDAAVRLIAEGRWQRASFQEITQAADIGFGSFYNHFSSQTASDEVLESWAQMLDAACGGR